MSTNASTDTAVFRTSCQVSTLGMRKMVGNQSRTSTTEMPKNAPVLTKCDDALREPVEDAARFIGRCPFHACSSHVAVGLLGDQRLTVAVGELDLVLLGLFA